MLETAIRRRYPIDAEKAATTVNSFLDDPDPRVALRAAQIAALMEGQNQKDEHNTAIAALAEIRSRLANLGHNGLDRPPDNLADGRSDAGSGEPE